MFFLPKDMHAANYADDIASSIYSEYIESAIKSLKQSVNLLCN